LLDAIDLSHHSSKESDKEEMPQSFGYLSEEDPNFQGSLEFVAGSNCLGRRRVCLETNPEKRKKALLTMRFLKRAVCPRKNIRQIPLMMSYRGPQNAVVKRHYLSEFMQHMENLHDI
jgi:hypothetical protein